VSRSRSVGMKYANTATERMTGGRQKRIESTGILFGFKLFLSQLGCRDISLSIILIKSTMNGVQTMMRRV
jgi:hypothetical protein